MTLKLGKAPARPGAVAFRFSDFAKTAQMPAPPRNFGHNRLVKTWGMLGNDTAGDCVFAGAAHEIMLWNADWQLRDMGSGRMGHPQGRRHPRLE